MQEFCILRTLMLKETNAEEMMTGEVKERTTTQ